MTYNISTTYFGELFTHTKIFGYEWIIGLTVILLCMLVVTRDIEKWGILFLPMSTLWHIAGIPQHRLFFIIGGILFVLNSLSLQSIGTGIQSAIQTLKPLDIQHRLKTRFNKEYRQQTQKAEEMGVQREVYRDIQNKLKLDRALKKAGERTISPVREKLNLLPTTEGISYGKRGIHLKQTPVETTYLPAEEQELRERIAKDWLNYVRAKR